MGGPHSDITPADIVHLMCISECTVRRCLTLFYQVGDVEPRPRTNGPKRLLGDFQRFILLRLILAYPGIYLQSEIGKVFGVTIRQCGAKLCFQQPYSPDLMPAEGVYLVR